MPVGFGWSAGDIAKAISILNRTYKALKDTGGAASEYQILTANLKRYVLVLETLQDLRPEGLDQTSVNALAALASTAGAMLIDFETNELCKYESTLRSRQQKSRLSGITKKTRYTFEIPKKVEKLLKNLGMVLDQILILLSSFLLKQGESISKQCSLIKAQIEMSQIDQNNLQKEQAESCAQLNVKLIKLIDVVSAQGSKLQIIQTVQSEMREHVHEQIESQARQDEKLENITAAIGNIQIDQDRIRRGIWQQGTELAKQRQPLQQLEADLATVCSGHMTGPDARSGPDNSYPCDMLLRRGRTCATNTTQDVNNGDGNQQRTCSVHDKSIIAHGPRLPLEQEAIKLLQEIGRQLCKLLLESTVQLIALTRYFMSISPQLLVVIHNLWASFPKAPRLSLQEIILFEDVLGRAHRLPYEYFRHWEHFQVQLKILFHNELEGDLVERNLFHILDARGRIIEKRSSEWSRMMFPGQRIAMSAILYRSRVVDRGRCPRCTNVVTKTLTSRTETRSFCKICLWESCNAIETQVTASWKMTSSWKITNRGECIFKRIHTVEPVLPPKTVWYCGSCGDGPHNPFLDTGCSACGHRRDSCCTVSTV